MRVCDNDYTCLSYRSATFRKPSVFTWDAPCTSCRRGTERAKAAHVPEPDIEPAPQRDAKKPPRVKKPPKVCATVGCTTVVDSRATLCKAHWGLSRRVNHAKCSTVGCKNKARRGSKCCKHYWASRPAPYRREKRA